MTARRSDAAAGARLSLNGGAVRRLKGLGAALLLATGIQCSEPSTATAPLARAPRRASLSLAPTFASLPGGISIDLSKVRGVVVDAGGDSVVSEAAFQGDTAVLSFTLHFSGNTGTFQVDLTAYDNAGQVAFHGVDTVTVKPGDNAPIATAQLQYAGPDAGVTKIQIIPKPVNLDAGSSAQLGVQGFNAAGQPVSTAMRVTWTSKNPSVAQVGQTSGIVTAGTSEGSTYVFATSASGAVDSALVAVHAPVASFAVTPSPAQVVRNDSLQLVAVLKDAAGNPITGRTVTWTIADASIATVSATGMLKGKVLGSTAVTASVEGKSADVPVSVVSPVDHITATPNPMSFASLGEQQTLAIVVTPKNNASLAGIATVVTVADPTIVSIDTANHVTALKNGTTSITIKADVASLTVPVTVKQVAKTLTVTPRTASSAAQGDTIRFTAAVFDSLGHAVVGAAPTWLARNTGVATVDTSGLVTTGATNGTSAIVASAGALADSGNVTLNRVAVRIAINVPMSTLSVGQTMVATASLLDSNGYAMPGTFTFGSSNSQVLAVTPDGSVTAVSQGSAALQAASGSLSVGLTIIVANPVGSNPAGVYGYYADLGSNSGHAPNFLLGTALTITQATTVTSLGVLTRAGGPHVMLALYTDLNGAPNQLIVSTPSTTMVLGRMEIPVTPTVVPAGTYWIMGIYDASASIGITFNTSQQVDYVSWTFGTALPTTFPGPVIYTGQLFNYWVRGNAP